MAQQFKTITRYDPPAVDLAFTNVPFQCQVLSPCRKPGSSMKKEDDDEDEDMEFRRRVKQNEDSDAESDDDAPSKSKRDEADDLVRKVRFNLESHDLFSRKWQLKKVNNFARNHHKVNNFARKNPPPSKSDNCLVCNQLCVLRVFPPGLPFSILSPGMIWPCRRGTWRWRVWHLSLTQSLARKLTSTVSRFHSRYMPTQTLKNNDGCLPIEMCYCKLHRSLRLLKPSSHPFSFTSHEPECDIMFQS